MLDWNEKQWDKKTIRSNRILRQVLILKECTIVSIYLRTFKLVAKKIKCFRTVEAISN